ncbi:MAG: hypothetical protein RJB38_875 [Pseudomonadota bacterium]
MLLAFGALAALAVAPRLGIADVVTCSGKSSGGASVELVANTESGQAVLTFEKQSSQGKDVQETVFGMWAQQLRVGQTPYSYFVVTLLDATGKEKGLLWYRDASCSVGERLDCAFNGELALVSNAAYPYQLSCRKSLKKN